MKVRHGLDDDIKRDKIVVEMEDTEDLYHLIVNQFDFIAQDGEQLSGHSFYLSISPEKAEELKQKLTDALESKK